MSEEPKQVDHDQPAKKHARPGSKWNSTNRHKQKGYSQPKGFARGALVKPK